MIKDLLSNSFAVSGKSYPRSCLRLISIVGETTIKDDKSPMMKSLISRAGDLCKNNDRLKFALFNIRYPEAYDERG